MKSQKKKKKPNKVGMTPHCNSTKLFISHGMVAVIFLVLQSQSQGYTGCSTKTQTTLVVNIFRGTNDTLIPFSLYETTR